MDAALNPIPLSALRSPQIRYGPVSKMPRRVRRYEDESDKAPITQDNLSYWIAQVAREWRDAAGAKQEDILKAGDVRIGTISRFENKRARPENIDRIVAAYAAVLRVTPDVLWEIALERWRRARPAETSAPGTRPRLPAPEPPLGVPGSSRPSRTPKR
jgi:transcriptional regulator with XRE-family HTH domain